MQWINIIFLKNVKEILRALDNILDSTDLSLTVMTYPSDFDLAFVAGPRDLNLTSVPD